MASWDPSAHRVDRPRPRHFVGPLILLGAGLLLLLNNLGQVPWSIWRDLWIYWPLLLVLLGIEAFVTGRVAWGTLVMLIILLPIVGLAVSAGSLGATWTDATRPSPDRLTETLRQPLDGATSASVAVEYGIGVLSVAPLPDSAETGLLASGEVFGHGGSRFQTRYELQGSRGVWQISPQDHGGMAEPGRLDLRLSKSVPLDLSIKSGVADTTLDLTDLRIPNLTLETGASRTRLLVPAHGETIARIEGGAASIEIVVPPNVAARILVDDGPNSISIDQTRFPRQGNEYRSASFETATDRVTLRIAVGAARLTVQ